MILREGFVTRLAMMGNGEEEDRQEKGNSQDKVKRARAVTSKRLGLSRTKDVGEGTSCHEPTIKRGLVGHAGRIVSQSA